MRLWGGWLSGTIVRTPMYQEELFAPRGARHHAACQTTACATITWFPLNVAAGEPYST